MQLKALQGRSKNDGKIRTPCHVILKVENKASSKQEIPINCF